jgi:hypothetical protein
MIDNKSIKKMAASLTRKPKNVFLDRRIMHPEREWFTGLFLSFFIMVGGISFMLFQYMQFGEVNSESVDLPEEGVIYRSGLVKDVLDDFAVRKNTYQELKKELVGNRVFVDRAPEIIVEDTPLPAGEVVDEVSVAEIEIPPVEEEEVASPTLSI